MDMSFSGSQQVYFSVLNADFVFLGGEVEAKLNFYLVKSIFCHTIYIGNPK